MGEDVTEWIFEYVSAEEEEDTDTEAEEADSSGESEKDWHILREEAEDRYWPILTENYAQLWIKEI